MLADRPLFFMWSADEFSCELQRTVSGCNSHCH